MTQSTEPKAQLAKAWSREAKQRCTRTVAVRALAGLSLAAAAITWAQPASADTLVIKRPGYHARYSFEAEPHLLLGLVEPPGYAHGEGFGIGFRGTVNIVNDGFIKTINNSIGVGFGADLLRYDADECIDLDSAGNCVRTDGVTVISMPVVMQWNFYISRNWSVFGEPGIGIRYEAYDGPGDDFDFDYLHLYLGGRYHFSDNVTLTMRVGYPTFSVGVSFLL